MAKVEAETWRIVIQLLHNQGLKIQEIDQEAGTVTIRVPRT